MARINFLIQSKNNQAGIYVRLRDGRKVDAKAKTKYLINPSDWSDAKGQPKNLKDENFKQLDEDLRTLSNDLLNHYNKRSSDLVINSQWLKDFLNPSQASQQPEIIPTKLTEYFEYYSLHKKSSMKASSHTKLIVNKHLIERFQKATNKEYLIKDVNADFKLKFEAYCKKERYAQNTIARSISFIKTLCYHARNNGIETHFQLNAIDYKTEKVEKIFLSLKEIEQIEKAELNKEYLINARDWLIISCETGQRVSDFMRFTKGQIRFEGSVPLIEFTQVKTGKIMAIPLSFKVRNILEKRGGEFPRKITDQRYNEYIKEVCQLAGLNQVIKGSKLDKLTQRKESGKFPKYELVTSHIGRRSFATNNYGRIPTSLLINVTGHTTELMFLQYIGKTVTEKAMQLAQYF